MGKSPLLKNVDGQKVQSMERHFEPKKARGIDNSRSNPHLTGLVSRKFVDCSPSMVMQKVSSSHFFKCVPVQCSEGIPCASTQTQTSIRIGELPLPAPLELVTRKNT